MDVFDLEYELPEELIAQRPLPERDGARLLVIDRAGSISHRRIVELADILRPALWIVNDTRVLPARLFAHKSSGGRVEILLLEKIGAETGRERWTALARPSRKLVAGTELMVEGAMRVTVCQRAADGTLELDLAGDSTVEALLERVGHVPLPPYVRRADTADDRDRYQTLFAERPGAVAAPTAGLHFSEELLASLLARGHRLARVTLHVGIGTFRPVATERLSEHRMHAERFEVRADAADEIDRARRDGLPVVAVGTTVVRTLESAASGEGCVRAGAGRTELFIQPPFRFSVVDALLTNFHLPRSTLLALVMAFGGVDLVRRAYRMAVDERYRFFSYGDAMLIGDGRILA